MERYNSTAPNRSARDSVSTASWLDAPRHYDLAQLRAAFDPLAFISHVTGIKPERPDAKGYCRVPGYGGLTVSPTGFYHHSAGIGGDALDLVAYLRHGVTCRGGGRNVTRDAIEEAAVFAHLAPTDTNLSSSRRPLALRRSSTTPASPRRRADRRSIDWQLVATYDYTNVDGESLFHVERYEGNDENGIRQKRFVQRPASAPGINARTGSGCMDGVLRVPYRLPDVARAIVAGESIYLVEGEKDADALALILQEEIGSGAATTTPGGASGWERFAEHYISHFRNAHVVLDGDTDPPGRAYMDAVARSLRGVAASIRVSERVATYFRTTKAGRAEA